MIDCRDPLDLSFGNNGPKRPSGRQMRPKSHSVKRDPTTAEKNIDDAHSQNCRTPTVLAERAEASFSRPVVAAMLMGKSDWNQYGKVMLNILLVATGGAIGSVLRYLTTLVATRQFGPSFPWGTLAVNIVGSLAIGIFAELIARRFDAPQEWRLFIITGLIGGFTTFSAFSLDVAVMVDRGDLLPAVIYLAASMLVSLLAVFAGLAIMRALL